MPDRITTLTTTRAICDELLAGPVPRVLGIVDTTHGWELVDDPELELLDDLFGCRLPIDWWGVALATTGRARRADEPTTAAWPVRMALVAGRDGNDKYLVTPDRDGTLRSAVLGPDGVEHTGPGDARPVGLVVDLARRALGLPTEVQPGNPIEQVIAGWGFDVLDAALVTANADLLDDIDAIEDLWPVPGFAPGESPATWAELHHELVEAAVGWCELSPAQVAWLDAGSFARYVQAHQPSVDQVFTAVRHLRVILRQDSVLPSANSLAGSVRAEPGEVG